MSVKQKPGRKQNRNVTPEVTYGFDGGTEILEPVGDDNEMQLSQTIVQETVSDMPTKVAELATDKTYKELKALQDVDFNPVKETDLVQSIIDSLSSKIDGLLKLDLEKELLNELVDLKSKPIRVKNDETGEWEEAVVEVDESSIKLGVSRILEAEEKRSKIVSNYTKLMQDALKQKRMLAGQTYGQGGSGAVSQLHKTTQMQTGILKGEALLQKLGMSVQKGAGFGGTYDTSANQPTRSISDPSETPAPPKPVNPADYSQPDNFDPVKKD